MIENPIISDWHPIQRQEPCVVGYCDGCGDKIYEGEEVIEFPDGLVIHREQWCAYEYCCKYGAAQKA
ncbi:YqaI family protein [Geobacillus thermodenitrificans]|uniref:YqaI family protein n=1 Tax=Geobacillus thermodenitrificans TaxID=33940 RepID=UPI003D1C9EE2